MRHMGRCNTQYRVLLVMAIGWLATAFADLGDRPRAGGSVYAASAPAAQPAQTDPHVNASASPDVTVTPLAPPTAQELAGDGLNKFIEHHATTHFENIGTMRNLARWRGGMQSICPVTLGLDPGYNVFVTERLRALARYVGAPLQSDPHCVSNVQILFTNNPQKSMDDVTKWASIYLRADGRYARKWRLIEYKGGHPIQGWYMVTTSGARVLNTDLALVGLDVWPVWPQVTQNYVARTTTGTRVGGGSGSGIGIGSVILIVDTSKVIGYPVGTIADYLSMLTLSVVQSPDHCDSLPSILDLMSSSCDAREKPKAMTAGDLAFLKALYYLNTGLGPSLSRDDIEDNMMRQFKLR